MGWFDGLLGEEGDISDGTVKDLYENTEADIDYSPERAVRVANKASVYINFDEQGALSMRSSSISMDQASERALRKVFGDMLFGDDRRNRERPKMIRSDVEYEEIGAATIGAGLAAAKVDEVSHTPYTPDYAALFETVVEGNWNMNPEVIGDFVENTEHYSQVVQDTAETVEEQMLELRPQSIDEIEQELERELEDRNQEIETE